MKFNLLRTGFVLAALYFSFPAHADIITLSSTGTIDGEPNWAAFGITLPPFSIGDSYVAEITFDTDAPDQNANSEIGTYDVIKVEGFINGSKIFDADGGVYSIFSGNQAPNKLELTMDNSNSTFNVIPDLGTAFPLLAFTLTAEFAINHFSDDGPITTAPDALDVTGGGAVLTYDVPVLGATGFGMPLDFKNFDMESSSAIPAPAALGFLGLGLAMIARELKK